MERNQVNCFRTGVPSRVEEVFDKWEKLERLTESGFAPPAVSGFAPRTTILQRGKFVGVAHTLKDGSPIAGPVRACVRGVAEDSPAASRQFPSGGQLVGINSGINTRPGP